MSGEAFADGARPIPLPQFSTVVQHFLHGADVIPRKIWVKAVQEAAQFYLMRFGPRELKDSSSYQSIGMAVYSHYPSIGGTGRRPWSKFSKALSQNIRHFRHRQSRQRAQLGIMDGELEMEDDDA